MGEATADIEGRIRAHAPDEARDLVVLAMGGSVSHGLYDPERSVGIAEDVDVVGAFAPGRLALFGLRGFEHWDPPYDPEGPLGDLDLVLYDLRKLVALWLKSNPTVLGMLWHADRGYLLRTPAFDVFRAARDAFSSTRAGTAFVGYAKDQARLVTRSRERPSPGSKRFASIQRFGYDVKAATHLVRIQRTGAEFLRDGVLRVDRTGIDAEELKGIRRGEWPWDRVSAEVERGFAELEEARAASPLPEEPETDRVEGLLLDILEARLTANRG